MVDLLTYRLTVSYVGTRFAGWQRQKNASSVQQTLEEALTRLLSLPTTIHGAGRTDAGVHARGQTAHLHLMEPFSLRGLVHGANHLLPPEIRIRAADRMPLGFHARKSALGKLYLYRLATTRVIVPQDAAFVMRSPGGEIDLEAIRRALEDLQGRHDFTAFALTGGSHRQPFRRIFAATADRRDQEIQLRFYGDGFLRGMVRSLAGTLVQIGLRQRDPRDLSHLLTGQPRSAAGPTAPANGLSLERVFYSEHWKPLESYAP